MKQPRGRRRLRSRTIYLRARDDDRAKCRRPKCLEHIPPASNRGIPKGLRMSESGALDSFWKDRVMAKPYSDDLRVRAIAIVEGGASRHEVAALLEVSPSSVINWLRRCLLY